MSPRKKNVSVFLFAFVLLSSFSYGVAYYSSVATEVITIRKVESIVRDGESTYRVYTDKGVFTNSDDLFFFKFNSSDLYNAFEVGGVYMVKTVGWRFTFLSQYPNIISIL